MYKEPIKFHYYEVLEYDRKSRSDDKSLSVEEVLERHAQILKDYAEKFLDGPIPDEQKYQEVGSGESIDERPEMIKLLKAIESPSIKAILVVDVQRLSRGDLEDAGRLIKLLRYTNTHVLTPYRTYDLRDEYDRDAFERELKKGNEYLEYFKKIQRQGTLASVKAGNYVGSVAPFGFNRIKIKDGNKECFTLTENKEQADVVRLIFDWYANEGIGGVDICKRLEAMGVKTTFGKTKWHPNIIYWILENVHYIGYVRWNWRKTIRVVEDQEIKVLRPKAESVDDYLIYKGKHKGIVSEELFNKVAEIRGNKPKVKYDTSLKNIFSGLMYCGRCGHKLTYNSFIKYGVEFAKPKIVCRNQKKCKSGYVDHEEVVRYITKTLKDCIEDFEVLIESKQDNSHKLHNNLISNLERKLKDLETQELLQWKAQTDPDPANRMPTAVFQMLNEQLLKEKEEIKDALCKAKESAPVQIDYRKRVQKFTDALAAINDPDVSNKIKNQYLKSIIERIDYFREPAVRLNKNNCAQFGIKPEDVLTYRYYQHPYEMKVKLRP